MMRRRLGPLFIFILLILTTCTNNVADTGSGASSHPGGGNTPISCPAHTNTTAAASQRGPITLNVLGWTSSPAEDAIVQQNLNGFMRLHPNIKVKAWNPISTKYADAMHTLAAHNQLPDAFFMPPNLTPEFISKGELLNLSPYMARDNVEDNAYAATLLAPFRCASGQVYGIPKDWGTLGVFYNKDLFRKAGISFPGDSWTWDDLRAIARKLSSGGDSASSVHGISLTADASRWLAFLFSDGGSVLSSDGTHATFNNSAGVDALNYYASFQRDDASSILPSDVGAAWSRDAFGKQRVAMVVEGPWLIPYLQANYPHTDYGVAPLPISPSGHRANLVFTNAWSASSTTRYPDAAWELIEYMTGKSVQENVLKQGFALPTLVNLADDPYVKTHPDINALFSAQPYGVPDYYGPQDDFIHNRLDLAISSVLLGQASARAALDNAAQQVNKALQS
jgi:multiple sugar transport system substrate-binding protein